MRILPKLFSTLILLSLSCLYLPAQAADSSSEKLSDLLKNMHSLQADFTQTILDNKGKVLQKSSGRMYLLRPNHFRWEVKRPMQQLLVTNGVRLWIYDPDLEQVTIRSLSKAAGETPAMLLSDENLSLGKEFTVRPIQNASSSLEWFLLLPKDKSTVVTSIKLGFLNQKIRGMQMQDHLGHTTIIEFNNTVINSSLSGSLFQFTPPPHIDVIDETRH